MKRDILSNEVKYLVEHGWILVELSKRKNEYAEWTQILKNYKSSEKYRIQIALPDYQSIGICLTKTYPRERTVIIEIKPDGKTYPDKFSSNLKYFKCDWTPRKPKDYLLINALCLHIREMIELQHGIEIYYVNNVLDSQ